MSNIVFFGTSSFSVPFLRIVHKFCQDHNHCLTGVVCQPDKPSMRGQDLREPIIKKIANELNICVWQPEKITFEWIDWFKKKNITIAVVVSYGKILPKNLIDAADLGFINVHASLLPRWRGASPIQRAIEAGDSETGICIIDLISKLDSGPIYYQEKIPIGERETSEDLSNRLATLGSHALINILPDILQKKIKKIDQSSLGISYAHRLQKEDGLIEWNSSAIQIINKVRAMHPWPGSYTFYKNRRIKLFSAKLGNSNLKANPGQIIEIGKKLVISTGNGQVEFSYAQLNGKSKMPIKDLLNGFLIKVGDYLHS